MHSKGVSPKGETEHGGTQAGCFLKRKVTVSLTAAGIIVLRLPPCRIFYPWRFSGKVGGSCAALTSYLLRNVFYLSLSGNCEH